MTPRQKEKKRGKLVIISGPSGVGKSTIARAVIDRLKDAYLSVSVTTRPQAAGERNGRDYWFVSPQEFRQRLEEGAFLEYAEVFGNLYGTPQDRTEEALNEGKIVILEIDVQGAKQVKAVYPQATLIFILPPSAEVLAERMGRRGRDSARVAARRLQAASDEITLARQYYDHLVTNDDLEQAIHAVVQIIRDAPVMKENSDNKQVKIGEN